MKLLCKLGIHKWGPWYWDRANHPILELLTRCGAVEAKKRKCERCGKIDIDFYPKDAR